MSGTATGEVWAGVAERVHRVAEALAVDEQLPHAGWRRPPVACLSEAELREAEAQLGVVLPERYRSFLAEVTAGGPGPFHGLNSLVRDADGRWGWSGPGSELTRLDKLGQPFLPEAARPALKQFDAIEPAWEEDEHEQWMERRQAVQRHESRTFGAVCLCNEGSGFRSWLAITGPHAGEVWTDEREAYDDLEPSGMSAHAWPFEDWYLNQLAAAEERLHRLQAEVLLDRPVHASHFFMSTDWEVWEPLLVSGGISSGLLGPDEHTSGITLTFGRYGGGSGVLMVRLDREPPASIEVWEDVVETSARGGGEVGWIAGVGCDAGEFELPVGDWRIRFSSRGRARGASNEWADGLVDFYLVEFWPAPPSHDTILRARSEDARRWLGQISA